MIAWGWRFALLEMDEGLIRGPHYETWFPEHLTYPLTMSWGSFESHSWVEAELDESYLRDD